MVQKNTGSAIVTATTKIFEILQPVEQADRSKVIQAVLTLLGETTVSFSAGSPVNPAGGASTATSPAIPVNKNTDEKSYFLLKKPNNKIEEFAVAAHYREEILGHTTSTKDDIKAVISAARRNFDNAHFSRDLGNAKRSGLFNKGNGRDIVLSHYGQSYVDALPDREALKSVEKPKGAGAKRVATKRVAAKKTKKAK